MQLKQNRFLTSSSSLFIYYKTPFFLLLLRQKKKFFFSTYPPPKKNKKKSPLDLILASLKKFYVKWCTLLCTLRVHTNNLLLSFSLWSLLFNIKLHKHPNNFFGILGYAPRVPTPYKECLLIRNVYCRFKTIACFSVI